MRHAKRDKWKDVALYDSAEAKLFKENKSLASYGETKYYSDAICLSNKGKIQAKMIREKLTEAEIPIKYVVSSPSCRARQTAVLSFGKHDQLNEVFFHRNIFNEFFKDWQVNLKQAFLNVPIIDGGNTVVTAHGGVIDKNLFKNSNNSFPIKLSEGGFYVISRDNGNLTLEHEFSKFEDFSKVFSFR